ncbi:MAG TPA: DNA polymerase I [Firmicutes bacterium]|nr:DNA polymerase I [Bacillota bacterium]
MGNKMLIIDGHSLAHRAFHALKDHQLRTSEGLPTSAVYGVANMILRLLENEHPDYLVVAEDVGKTFRHEAYAAYKGTRKEMDDDLRVQLPYIKEFYESLGAPVIGVPGFEADDVIGTMARQAQEEGLHVCIVTGDKDAFQLAADGICVYYTHRGITNLVQVTADYLQQKYGLTPAQWADYKALRGDPSDNIPGVPGIGEKTATKLLKEFDSLEALLDQAEAIKNEKLKKVILSHTEEARRWQELVTIRQDVPLPIGPAACRFNLDQESLTAFFRKLEFRSLLGKFKQESAPAVTVGAVLTPETKLLTGEELPDFLEGDQGQPVAVQFLASAASWQKGEVLGVSLAKGQDNIVYLPLTGGKDSWPEPLVRWLTDGETKKLAHDGKTQMVLADLYGLALDGLVFDTLIAAYLVSGGRWNLSLENTAHTLLGVEVPVLQDEKGKKREIFALPTGWTEADLATAGGRRTAAILKLHPVLTERIREEGLSDLFYEVEMPLVRILFAMEKAGVKVSPDHLGRLQEKFTRRIKELETEIYQLAGEEFNIASPKQLGVILFERLGLPVVKRTKTGYSTDAEVLEELADRHPLVGKVLDYRGLVKLESTYVESLLGLAAPPDYRIHTTFNQAVTATGRLSSTDPNLQNIPVRSEEGRAIRRCFIPKDGDTLLLAADYSQIELRLLAHFAEDEKLVAAFQSDQDVHRRTAAEIFNLAPAEVSAELRARAKAVNFGIIYGISGFGLARGVGVSRKEAEAFIDAYFSRYQGVKSYLEQAIVQARAAGYVTTIMNRRRYLPDLKARNFQRRAFAERMARNTPIQGSAADLIKLAMVRVDARLRREKLPATLLLQVHDELLLEVERAALPEAARILREEMEGAFALKVPLEVDLKSGENWGDLG